MKVYRDWYSVMKSAEEKGMAKGLEEGLKKGLLSTARNMKQMGMPNEDIMKATGLTEEEVMQL